MSIPYEKLQQLFQEIEQKAAVAQQDQAIIRSQIAAKQREVRKLQLSSQELDALPQDTPVYDGVGKMFVQTSFNDIKTRQAKQGTELQSDITNLQKKLDYLDTTIKNSREHMEQILKRGS